VVVIFNLCWEQREAILNNKGHWAKSVMCPKSSKSTGDPVDPDKKVTDESSKLGSATKPTLKVISVDQELPVTSDVSVKAITIPSVGKHYYTDFILGNHNWKQKCTWAYGKEKIRGAERNLPDFFRLCPTSPKIFRNIKLLLHTSINLPQN
jgi:hypothetical protein